MIFNPQARRNVIKLVGERSSSFDLARGRLVLLSGFFVLAYIFVAARAVDLVIIQGKSEKGRELAEKSAVPHQNIMRADITDRNGVLLATTIKMAALYADPKLISSAKETAEGLVKIFPDLSYGEVLQKLQSDKRFVWLRRDLVPEDQYKVLQLGQPGLAFKYEDRRFYPQGKLAAHLVGYSSVDNRGLAGVERSFDSLLNKGEPLQLTLDVRLQHALRREVLKAMKDFNATGAAGVVMDVSNGEILAGVSLPDFEPQEAGNTAPEKIFNRLTLGDYELGSVFKIFSTAAYLDIKDVPLSASFDASKPLKSGKFVIADYHAQNRIMTVPEVFMHSSNIGAAMMGRDIGGERLKQFYEDVGLLVPLDFEILETAKPQVPDPWREVNTLTASYGHGIATTPLHLVSAVSSIVNGGLLVKPRLVMKEEGQGASRGMRVVSEKTAHRMRQLMRLVVTDGTGAKADVPGYNVGGKTGTAEKNSRGRYDKNRLLSSFVGIFPSEAPRYAIYVVVDEPKGNAQSHGYATAGWVAAPAVARTVASMASILGMPPEKTAPQDDPGASLKQYISVNVHE